MDVLKLGAQLLASQLDKDGDGLDLQDITSALSGLMSNNDGNVDLSGMVSKLGDNGLASVAASWLGDGENEAISAEQVGGLFSGEQIDDFAAKLGVDSDTALDSLSNALPNMVDQSSSGGSLLDMVGGVSGLMGMAKKFL